MSTIAKKYCIYFRKETHLYKKRKNKMLYTGLKYVINSVIFSIQYIFYDTLKQERKPLEIHCIQATFLTKQTKQFPAKKSGKSAPEKNNSDHKRKSRVGGQMRLAQRHAIGHRAIPPHPATPLTRP